MLFAILAGLAIFMVAAPAQAEHARSNKDRRYGRRHGRPLITVTVRNPYPHYYRYRGTPIWTGVHRWQHEMRTNFALMSRNHNLSICQRHLERYGWDRVAETRCPAAGVSYEDYLEYYRRSPRPAGEDAAATENPDDREVPAYTEPSRPVQEPDREITEPTPADTGELWLNLTGCPMKIDGVAVPPDGLRVANPQTANISVLAKKTTCQTTERREIGPGIIGIVCRGGK